MVRAQVTCPECQASLNALEKAVQGKKIKCLKCGSHFRVPADGGWAANVLVAAPFTPPPHWKINIPGQSLPEPEFDPASIPEAEPGGGHALAWGLGAAVLGLFLLGGVAFGIYLSQSEGHVPAGSGDDPVVASIDPFTLPSAPAKQPLPVSLPNEASPSPAPQVEADVEADDKEPAAAPRKDPAPEDKPRAAPPSPPEVKDPPRPAKAAELAKPAKADDGLRVVSKETQLLINKAIDNGARWLRKAQTEKLAQANAAHAAGYAGLAGLTLLECGVPKGDPAVQNAARVVRVEAAGQAQTYCLALSILFLDRLGDPGDREIIQTLAARLIAGQNEVGGWTYQCPILSKGDNALLLTFLRQQQPFPTPIQGGVGTDLNLVVGSKPTTPLTGIEDKKEPLGQGIVPGSGDPLLSKGITSGTKNGKDGPAGKETGLIKPVEPVPDPKKPDTSKVKKDLADKKLPRLRPDKLPLSVRSLPIISNRPLPTAFTGKTAKADDNSNSQFAMMALWVARRHNVPVERTMALVLKRYKASQHSDGGWSYHTVWGRVPAKIAAREWGFGTRPSMTCVGLLGLAMGHGSAKESKAASAAAGKNKGKLAAVQADPAINKGLRKLGTYVGHPTGKKVIGFPLDLYTLWSVERVGVLYNLKTIGGKDWYGWAVDILLGPNRQPEGFWQGGNYPGSSPLVDTCFALLILRRANLVQDLTDNLQNYLPIADPDSHYSPGSRK
jgi:hypothetical protein